jgi:DNA helicase-2/ATP-dependent DNA helicase PcrA
VARDRASLSVMTAERHRATRPPIQDGDVRAAPVALETVRGLVRGLDRDQRRAVTFGDGPLLVIAGPGTGKTEVITRRVAWLVASGRARPSEILALTFTERAADEMQARVDLLLPYGQVDTGVHTFHAFGDRLLRSHGHEIGLPADPRVIGRPEAIALLRSNLSDLGLERYAPLGDPTRFLGLLVETFGRAKQAGITPAEMAAFAAELRAGARAVDVTDGADLTDVVAALLDEASAHEELARAYERYAHLMRERSLVDHADQVGLALRLVDERPAVRALLRRRYRYVVVDEGQDADVQQLRLVRAIVGESGNVMFVGDDDQAIYGFRGGVGDGLHGLATDYPSLRHIVLRRNHRSRAPILAAARRLIRHNDPYRLEVTVGVDKALVPVRRTQRPRLIQHQAFATANEEAEQVALDIVARLEAGARPGSIAVLVRTNADASPLLDSLRVRGVPVRASGSSGLFGHREVRDLLSLVRAIDAPGRSEDLYAILASGVYAVEGDDLTAILELASRRRRRLWDTCVELVDQPGILRIGERARDELRRAVTDLRESMRLAHQRSTAEVVYGHLRRSGWLARLVAEAERGSDAPLRRVARAFETIRQVAEVSADGRLASVAPLLTDRLDLGDDPADDDDPGERVAVLTVHQAKGLEFDVVYLMGLAEGRFPLTTSRPSLDLPVALTGSRAPDDPERRLAEERRLFYVGITRARDELLLSHARTGARGGRSRRPSPFIAEALGRPVDAAPADADALDAFASSEPVSTPVALPVADPRASRQLTLSFSQVDDYLACPKRYWLRHELRVPTPANHALVVGSALHQAVATANLARKRGETPDEASVMTVFRSNWVSEGFLSPEHEAARFAAGEAALRTFLDAAAQDATREVVAVEQPFDVRIGADRVRGRYDAVSRTTAGVVITDYKSGDIRDPARARQRARSSLQLAVYSLAHRASTGETPAAVELHFLEGGTVGRTTLSESQLERTQSRIAAVADGIRSGEFEATPGYPACQWCPYRRICPSAA